MSKNCKNNEFAKQENDYLHNTITSSASFIAISIHTK